MERAADVFCGFSSHRIYVSNFLLDVDLVGLVYLANMSFNRKEISENIKLITFSVSFLYVEFKFVLITVG